MRTKCVNVTVNCVNTEQTGSSLVAKISVSIFRISTIYLQNCLALKIKKNAGNKLRKEITP